MKNEANFEEVSFEEAKMILKDQLKILNWEFDNKDRTKLYGLFIEDKCVALVKIYCDIHLGKKYYYLDAIEAFVKCKGYGAKLIAKVLKLILESGNIDEEDFVLVFKSLNDDGLRRYYKQLGAINTK
jgi:hypothetical protein